MIFAVICMSLRGVWHLCNLSWVYALFYNREDIVYLYSTLWRRARLWLEVFASTVVVFGVNIYFTQINKCKLRLPWTREEIASVCSGRNTRDIPSSERNKSSSVRSTSRPFSLQIISFCRFSFLPLPLPPCHFFHLTPTPPVNISSPYNDRPQLLNLRYRPNTKMRTRPPEIRLHRRLYPFNMFSKIFLTARTADFNTKRATDIL